MADLERIKNLAVGNLAVASTLTVGGVPVLPAPPATAPGPRVAGGRVRVTGSARVPTGLASVAAAVASFGEAVEGPAWVSAVAAGPDLVVTVSGAASGVPAVVNWVALGG